MRAFREALRSFPPFCPAGHIEQGVVDRCAYPVIVQVAQGEIQSIPGPLFKPLDIFRGVAEQLAKEPDFEIAYWTCRFPEKVDRTKFPEAVIHFSEDAIKGIPARDFNVFDFEPLGEELAGQMYECESHALTMMNRMHFSSSLGVRE